MENIKNIEKEIADYIWEHGHPCLASTIAADFKQSLQVVILSAWCSNTLERKDFRGNPAGLSFQDCVISLTKDEALAESF